MLDCASRTSHQMRPGQEKGSAWPSVFDPVRKDGSPQRFSRAPSAVSHQTEIRLSKGMRNPRQGSFSACGHRPLTLMRCPSLLSDMKVTLKRRLSDVLVGSPFSDPPVGDNE